MSVVWRIGTRDIVNCVELTFSQILVVHIVTKCISFDGTVFQIEKGTYTHLSLLRLKILSNLDEP